VTARQPFLGKREWIDDEVKETQPVEEAKE